MDKILLEQNKIYKMDKIAEIKRAMFLTKFGNVNYERIITNGLVVITALFVIFTAIRYFFQHS